MPNPLATSVASGFPLFRLPLRARLPAGYAGAMKIAVGADHAGYQLKAELVDRLKKAGHEILDHGTHTADSVDYPDFAALVCRDVAAGRAEQGLLVCGTGQGMAMTANRYREIRAAVCAEPFSARMARAHNNANVLCIGARVVGGGAAGEIVDAFFATGFEGGRHQRRIEKINGSSGGASR